MKVSLVKWFRRKAETSVFVEQFVDKHFNVRFTFSQLSVEVFVGMRGCRIVGAKFFGVCGVDVKHVLSKQKIRSNSYGL